MKNPYNPHVSFRLPIRLLEQLKEEAKRDSRTLSQVILLAVIAYLETKK